MIEIVKVFMINVEVIIMDEFIVVLMEWEISKFFEVIIVLKKNGVFIVYIFYWMEEIFVICDRIIVMCDG